MNWCRLSSPFTCGTVAALAVLFMLLAAAATSAARAELAADVVERYRSDLIGDIDRALVGARELRDRIATRDIPGAQKAWINSRIGWERSEVFTAGFVPELDDAIDAWPNAVAGFHGIEAKLFAVNPSDFQEEMDALIGHLTTLDEQIRTIKLTPQGLLNGLTRLAYEVGESKADGGESRLSGTSLNEMCNNVEGIDAAYRTLFASSLEAADAKLAEEVRRQIDRLKVLLAVDDLKKVDPDALRKTSEALTVTLQAAGPKIGLATPTLEEVAK
jgi:iron uptake system component EfeO